MASTYTLISSNVLGSSAASVTFSAIPSTYTDLVLRMSAAGDDGAQLAVQVNSITTNYSQTQLRGGNSSATSFFGGVTTKFFIGQGINNVAQNGANRFGSAEIYIPNYTASQSKPVSFFTVTEENANTSAWIFASAQLLSNTAAISQLTITAPNSSNGFVSGSSFYLYGIKNS